jgi:hypothetical protein
MTPSIQDLRTLENRYVDDVISRINVALPIQIDIPSKKGIPKRVSVKKIKVTRGDYSDSLWEKHRDNLHKIGITRDKFCSIYPLNQYALIELKTPLFQKNGAIHIQCYSNVYDVDKPLNPNISNNRLENFRGESKYSLKVAVLVAISDWNGDFQWEQGIKIAWVNIKSSNITSDTSIEKLADRFFSPRHTSSPEIIIKDWVEKEFLDSFLVEDMISKLGWQSTPDDHDACVKMLKSFEKDKFMYGSIVLSKSREVLGYKTYNYNEILKSGSGFKDEITKAVKITTTAQRKENLKKIASKIDAEIVTISGFLSAFKDFRSKLSNKIDSVENEVNKKGKGVNKEFRGPEKQKTERRHNHWNA